MKNEILKKAKEVAIPTNQERKKVDIIFLCGGIFVNSGHVHFFLNGLQCIILTCQNSEMPRVGQLSREHRGELVFIGLSPPAGSCIVFDFFDGNSYGSAKLSLSRRASGFKNAEAA